MKLVKPLIYLIIRSLPLLRCNNFKIVLYRLLGYQLSKGVIVSSSAQIFGSIKLKVGNNTFIGHQTLITGGQSKVNIGSNCDISSRVSIVSGTHQIDMINQRTAGEGEGKNINIEDGVWIGLGAIILPGVTVGYKSVIGAGSVVTGDIPPYCVAVGNPCKVIKMYDKANNCWVKNVSLGHVDS